MDHNSGRRDIFAGQLGKTQETIFQVASESGALYDCKAHVCINADRDQALVAKLIDGELNRVSLPETQEVITIQLPVVVHYPKRSLMLIVVPPSQRHRVTEVLIDYFKQIGVERQKVPGYVLTPRIVLSGALIPKLLADLEESAASTRHQQKMADELEKLEQQRSQLTKREQELAELEDALMDKSTNFDERQGQLAIQNTKKEQELEETQADLARKVRLLKEAKDQTSVELAQEREQLQRHRLDVESELRKQRETLESFRRETEGEIAAKLEELEASIKSKDAELEEKERQLASLLASVQQAAETREKTLSSAEATAEKAVANAQATAEQALSAARETAQQELAESKRRAQEELSEARQAAEQEITEALAKSDAILGEAKATAEKEVAEQRAQMEIAIVEKRTELEAQLEKEREAFETARRKSEMTITEQRAALESARKELTAEKEQFFSRQAEYEEKLDARISSKEHDLEQRAEGLRAKEAEQQAERERLHSEVAKLKHVSEELQKKSKAQAERLAEMEAREAEQVQQREDLERRAADLEETARVLENYQSLSFLTSTKDKAPAARPPATPVARPAAVVLESEAESAVSLDDDGLEDGWDVADEPSMRPPRRDDVTEVISFEEIEIEEGASIEDLDEEEIEPSIQEIIELEPSVQRLIRERADLDDDVTGVSPVPAELAAEEAKVAQSLTGAEGNVKSVPPPMRESQTVETRLPKADPAVKTVECDRWTAQLGLKDGAVRLVVGYKGKPARKWSEPQVKLQTQRLPTYELVTLTVDGKGVGEVCFPFDVADDAVRALLVRLSERFAIEVEVNDVDRKALQAFTLEAQLGDNARLALDDASGFNSQLAGAASLEGALAAFHDPQYDKDGKRTHPFEGHGFADASLNDLSRPGATKAALGIVSFWSEPENHDYLILKKSFPISYFRAVQSRVLERGLYYGLNMNEAMKERLVALKLADSAPDVVTLSLSHFHEVCLSIRTNNDLTEEEIWQNWKALLQDCEEYQITPDRDIEMLAKKSARDLQRKTSHEGRDSAEAIQLPDTVEAEEYEDFSQLGADELLSFLKYAEHRRDAAIALARLKDPRHLTELASICELMDPDEVIDLAPELIGYGAAAEESMLNLLNSRDAVVAQTAALVLGELRSTRAIGTIINLLGSARANQYLVFAWALGAIGPEIRKPLIKGVKAKSIAKKRVVDAIAFLLNMHGADETRKLRKERILKGVVQQAEDERQAAQYQIPSERHERVVRLVRLRGTVQETLADLIPSDAHGNKKSDPELFSVIDEI